MGSEDAHEMVKACVSSKTGLSVSESKNIIEESIFWSANQGLPETSLSESRSHSIIKAIESLVSVSEKISLIQLELNVYGIAVDERAGSDIVSQYLINAYEDFTHFDEYIDLRASSDSESIVNSFNASLAGQIGPSLDKVVQILRSLKCDLGNNLIPEFISALVASLGSQSDTSSAQPGLNDAVKSLTNKIDQLQSKASKYKSDLNVCEGLNSRKDKQNKELRQSLSRAKKEHDKRVFEKRDLISQAKKIISTPDSDLNELKINSEELSRLKGALIEKNEVIQKLDLLNSENASSFSLQVEALEERVSQLSAEISTFMEERDASTKEKRAALKTVDGLKAQLSAKTKELERENKEKTDIVKHLEILERDMSSIKEERDARAKEKGQAKKAIEDLKQQVSANVAELEKERKERAAGAERVKALEEELAGVKGERDARAKEKGEAKKAVEDLKQQVSANVAELEKERKERAAGAERVKALEEELAGVKGERDARAKEKGEAKKAVEDLKQQVSANVAELEKERKERAAGAERVKALEEEVAPLQHELASYAAVLKRVQKSRDDHAQSRYGLAQQINGLKSELTLKIEELQIARNRAGSASDQLRALEGERDARAKEKEEAREEAELTLLQLHQVQEELESVFLADQAKQKQLEELKQQVSAKTAELEKERKEQAAGAERAKALEEELAGVKGERDVRAKEKAEACEEAELHLLQLHQVQEELEHYFLLSREQNSLLVLHAEQQKRVEHLLNDVVHADL